ncbi:hypothetical protein [Aggregatilinea lenta]|uniref:hypothetical protein n=1 Tax=Aggregatilinea lenta TaxID=913108 RepID=UPI000E5B25FE|nr:hypothetical protein [Aggregatilinea lenta]
MRNRLLLLLLLGVITGAAVAQVDRLNLRLQYPFGRLAHHVMTALWRFIPEAIKDTRWFDNAYEWTYNGRWRSLEPQTLPDYDFTLEDVLTTFQASAATQEAYDAAFGA